VQLGIAAAQQRHHSPARSTLSSNGDSGPVALKSRNVDLLGNTVPQAVNQDVMVDPVEELRQVDIDHDPPPRLDVRLRGQDRILRTSARTEAVAVFAERGMKQGLQHLE
jgi:hypothetical protein